MIIGVLFLFWYVSGAGTVRRIVAGCPWVSPNLSGRRYQPTENRSAGRHLRPQAILRDLTAGIKLWLRASNLALSFHLRRKSIVVVGVQAIPWIMLWWWGLRRCTRRARPRTSIRTGARAGRRRTPPLWGCTRCGDTHTHARNLKTESRLGCYLDKGLFNFSCGEPSRYKHLLEVNQSCGGRGGIRAPDTQMGYHIVYSCIT